MSHARMPRTDFVTDFFVRAIFLFMFLLKAEVLSADRFSARLPWGYTVADFNVGGDRFSTPIFSVFVVGPAAGKAQ